MGRKDRIHLLAELFHQADTAYTNYEQKVLKGNWDIQWPEWYADYLIGHGLDMLVEDRIAADLLAGFLLRSKAEFRTCNSKLSWEEFAANRIVEMLV